MTVYYDCDGKKLEHVHGDFCFFPNPHVNVKFLEYGPEDGNGMCDILSALCRDCGLMAAPIKVFWATSCAVEHEPCEYCGLRGICASDCGGVMEALLGEGVYLSRSMGGGGDGNEDVGGRVN